MSEPRQSRPEIRRILANLKGPKEWREPRPGQQLGTYLLVSRIGWGAFGEVWLAKNTSADTDAALKVFRPGRFVESLENSAIRFHDGAAAMTKLRKCPQVVDIYEGATSTNGYLWFAMEYFPQRDLKEYTKSNKLVPHDAFSLIKELLAAVRAAHTNPGGTILHRDVRPENILIRSTTDTPNAVLADFDIAYYEDLFRERQETGLMLSNARYVPLDVVQSDDPVEAMRTRSIDLYACAVCILEILTSVGAEISSQPGKISALLAKQGVGKNLSPSHRRRIAGFLSKALSQDKEVRFPRIEDFESAWELTERQRFGRESLIIVPILCVIALIGIAFDWSWFNWRDKAEIRALWSVGLAVTALFPITALASWALANLSSRASAARQAMHQWVRCSPRKALLVAGLLLVSPLFSFHVADVKPRLGHAIVSSTQPCVLVDSEGFAIRSWKPSPNESIRVDGVREVVCSSNKGLAARIVGQSLLTPVPPLLVLEEPEFHVRSVSPGGPNAVSTTVGGFLARVDFGGTASDFPPSSLLDAGLLNDEAVDIVAKMKNGGVLKCHAGCSVINLESDGTNIGKELVSRGLLRARDPAVEGFLPYFSEEETAKADQRGLWGELAVLERVAERASELAACSERCCRGKPCDEHDTCEAQTACMLCRDKNLGRWELELQRVDRAIGWREEKVCISTDTCSQACVDVPNIGTTLARVGCPLNSTDFSSVFLEVMGSDSNGREQRIAEKHQRFTLPNETTPCKKLIFKGLTERKALITNVVFGVTYVPPTMKRAE